ncbi:MAG: hypothetical protein AAGA56_26480 [Myxococcota bacterium]
MDNHAYAGSLAAHVQRRLMRLYALDGVPDVDTFVIAHDDVERERVLVQADDDELRIRVELPPAALTAPLGVDTLCQLVEGVSHFILIAQRAQVGRSTTELELELQAEIDKFIFLVEARSSGSRDSIRWAYTQLFERMRFVDHKATPAGERYRVANWAAARIVKRWRDRWRGDLRRSTPQLRRELRAFYRMDQQGKLALARAA